MQAKQVVRIALVSPSDVQEERDLVQSVVGEINDLLRQIRRNALLELSRWETDGRPGMHPLGPQGRLDDALQIPNQDIVVGIFRHRLGTPVLGSASGTVHELRQAIDAWKTKGSPQVMVYFWNNPQQPPPDDPQYAALLAFKKELLDLEKPLVSHYPEMADFRQQVFKHLFSETETLISEPAAPRSGLQITLEAEPVCARAEGLTELVGNIFVRCTYHAAHAPANDYLLTLILYMNGTVTSRLSHVPTTNVRFVHADSLRLDVILSEGDRPGVVPIRGRLLGGNGVIFEVVRLRGLKAQDHRVLQIGNLRVNANGITGGGPGIPAVIAANIIAAGATVDNPVVTVGTVARGLLFGVRGAQNEEQPTPSGFQINRCAGLPLSQIAMLRFAEGFTGAFKSRASEAPRTSESSPSGILERRNDGSVVFSGAADTGTRLQAIFHGIPTGLRLYVSSSSNCSPIQAEIVTERSTLVGSDMLTARGTQLTELSSTRGIARAVWEIIQPDWAWNTSPGHIDIAVFAQADPGSSSVGSVHVNGSFYPIPTQGLFSLFAGGQANAELPIPRFADTSAAIALITIEDGA
jgi:hypothetical protein